MCFFFSFFEMAGLGVDGILGRQLANRLSLDKAVLLGSMIVLQSLHLFIFGALSGSTRWAFVQHGDALYL